MRNIIKNIRLAQNLFLFFISWLQIYEHMKDKFNMAQKSSLSNSGFIF